MLPQQDNNPNIIWIGDQGFEAAPTQVLVRQDEFKSGYECPRCGDREHRLLKGGTDGKHESVISCPDCDGHGKRRKAGQKLLIKCSTCEATGKITCPECKGKGGPTIVIGEEQKGRPTTGIVVSIGSDITLYQRGNRVLYPSFSGHAFDITGTDAITGKTVNATLVVMVESDIKLKVHGKQLEAKSIKKSMALGTNA